MRVTGIFVASLLSGVIAQTGNWSTTHGHCSGAVLVNSTVLQIGPNEILYERHRCLPLVNVTDSDSSPSPTASAVPASNTTTSTTTDVSSANDTSVTSDPTVTGSATLKRRGFFDIWPLCIFYHTCRPAFFPPYFFPPPPKPTRTPPPPKDVCGVPCQASCNDNVGQLPPVTDDCQTIQDSFQIFNTQLAPTFTVASGHQETLTFGTCTIFFENLGNFEIEYCWTDLGNKSAIAEAACFPPVHPPFSEGLCTSFDNTWSVGIAHS